MTAPSFNIVSLANGWRVGRFAALAAVPGLVHAVTTRGAPDVQALRHDMASAAGDLAGGLGLARAAWVDQVHGWAILEAPGGGCIGAADGLVTTAPGLALVTRSADCLLVLAADPDAGVVGTAHASWRGTVRAIAVELIGAMVRRFAARPERIIAGLCPCAGPCCYEVGPEVRAAAIEGLGPSAGGFFHGGPERFHFDLPAANAAQLRAAGLTEANIHRSGLCTLCRNDLFPSHRREGAAAGRFAAVIALAP